MRYPIVIEPGNERTAWGVVVPDLPGCFSAGDSLDEALLEAEQAVELHMTALMEAGHPIPAPSQLQAVIESGEFAGWIPALLEVDITRLEGPAERINITLPKVVLSLIDRAAERLGVSRSGFIRDAAIRAIPARVGTSKVVRLTKAGVVVKRVGKKAKQVKNKQGVSVKKTKGKAARPLRVNARVAKSK